MELLPKDIREAMPELYANEEIGLAAQALVKFFTPDAGWSTRPRSKVPPEERLRTQHRESK